MSNVISFVKKKKFFLTDVDIDVDKMLSEIKAMDKANQDFFEWFINGRIKKVGDDVVEVNLSNSAGKSAFTQRDFDDFKSFILAFAKPGFKKKVVGLVDLDYDGGETVYYDEITPDEEFEKMDVCFESNDIDVLKVLRNLVRREGGDVKFDEPRKMNISVMKYGKPETKKESKFDMEGKVCISLSEWKKLKSEIVKSKFDPIASKKLKQIEETREYWRGGWKKVVKRGD